MTTRLIALLGVALAVPCAHAQLAVSANDNKIVLVDGTPTVVQNPAPDTVAIIDLGANPPRLLHEFYARTSVVGPPLSVAVAPDESFALVTGAMKLDPSQPGRLTPDNKLSVISLQSRPPVVMAELEAGLGAAGVSITRDGTLALVANRNEGSVSVFRVRGSVLTKLGTVAVGNADSGVAHVAIAPDGRSALVTRDGDHTISTLAIDGERVSNAERDFGVGLKPYGLVIAPDGRHAVVAHLGLGRGDNDTISLIDLTLRPPRVVETYTVGQTPEGIALSPDGKLLAVVTMNGSNKPHGSPFYAPSGRVVLFRLAADRLQFVSHAPVGVWPQGAVFSSDGRKLLVQSMSERNIAVFAIKDSIALFDTGLRIPLRGGGAALRTAERPVRPETR
jgi:DNA-binding beta-propeller fold protein YncE